MDVVDRGNDLPEELLHSRHWRAFTADTDPEEAKRKFVARYGKEPQQAFLSRGILLVGPIPAISLRGV